MNASNTAIIAIGGSSGSIPVLIQIINGLPEDFAIPIVLIVHRMRNVESDLKHVLSATKKIIEPEDKDGIKAGTIYLAPQNYHLLIEGLHTFSMDYSEPVNYSRPSIDVTFESIADIYGSKAIGILLSGANKDGAAGLKAIIDNGGRAVAQDPKTAEYPIMPESAIKNSSGVEILTPENIVSLLHSLF